VTFDVSVARGIVKAFGDRESVLEIDVSDNLLKMSDLTAKTARDRKRNVTIATVQESIDASFEKPSRCFSHEFDASVFCDAIKRLGKYKTVLTSRPKYSLICVHILEKEVRFVCGNGLRFAVISRPLSLPRTDLRSDGDGVKYVLPVEQTQIIAAACESSDKMTLCWKNPQECYIEAGNMKMLLTGIPKEEYINYEAHAYREADAKSILDMPRDNYVQMVNVSGACRDAEEAAAGKFHSVQFVAGNDVLRMVCDEGRYHCDVEFDGKYYDISSKPVFKSLYSWEFLSDLASAANKENIRFSCIDEQGILLAEPCNLDTESDRNGIPKRKVDGDGHRLIFFFTAVTENE